MALQSVVAREEMQTRLRRIEGQVRGVQRMIDDDRDCRAIAQQLTAVQSALRSARTLFLQAYARECLLDTDNATAPTDVIDELISMMAKVE